MDKNDENSESIKKEEEKEENNNEKEKDEQNVEEEENIEGSVKKEEVPPLPPYIIKDHNLIISTNEITDQLILEFEQILFINTLNEKDPFYSIGYINLDLDSQIKRQKTRNIYQSKVVSGGSKLNEISNDYIIINSNIGTPYEVRKCSNQIKKVIFENCNFTNESIFNLKKFMTMLKAYNFSKIAIYKNNISDECIIWKCLKQLFKENFNIRWVSFKDSGLNDKIFEEMILGMTSKRIKYLNISQNKITNKGMNSLYTFLIKNQTLLILDISSNKGINFEGIKIILKGLTSHPNIKKLNFSNNNLVGSGKYIAQILKKNKVLQTLLLRNINMTSKDIEYLAEEICNNNCQIKYLDIGLNETIGKDGLKSRKIISNNKTLTKIGLDGLHLTMDNYYPIFQAIQKNKTIESYSLNMNDGLKFKGVLNFFLYNKYVKEFSFIPWNFYEDKEQVFSNEQLIHILQFHQKDPQIKIIGVNFIEEEVENVIIRLLNRTRAQN